MRLAAAAALALLIALPAEAAGTRNVVIFVADGLRYSSVTPETAPTMAKLRREGVDFANSHSVYPTLTTANASAIATGHYLGDTGNYANSMYFGAPIPCHQDMTVAFVEDDCVLRDVKGLFPNDYVAQTTLTQAARAAGMNTVVIGKKGPAAIQYLAGLDSDNKSVDGPLGIFIDEATNRPTNLDGTPSKSTMLSGMIGIETLTATGETAPAFTAVPNIVQQGYLRQTVTQVLIPRLKDSGKPFAMLYWSRDPDVTQHNATDSEGKLLPGINSTSARAAIYNADSDLKGILDALKQWGLDRNTDVFVIADHGFSVVAKGIPTRDGRVEKQTLAPGFLAYDVAKWLGGQKVFDPDRANAELDPDSGERPQQGSGLIGPSADAPQALVVANGATDYIYIPDGSRATAKRIFDNLIQQPYLGGVFVNDALLKGGAGDFAGALAMSDINLIGSSKLVQPSIVVAYRTFVVGGCKLGEQMCAAELVDSPLHVGQGNHGSFSRADTRNFMAAIGPDFKTRFVDEAPVGNVDVAPTLAHILGLNLTGPGTLKGRVAKEALKGGKMPKVTRRVLASHKAANGVQTIVDVQQVGSTRYFDAGGIAGRMVGLKTR